MDGQTPRKRSLKRRAARVVGIFCLLVLVAVIALPWLAGTAPARLAIVKVVNNVLAPSTVEIKGLSLSWTGSSRLTGLTLKNRQGKTLIEARQAVIDRGLIALARNHRDLGTITVDGAVVDIERRADGSIDLIDALIPPKTSALPAPSPKASIPMAPIAVTLRVVRGALTLKSPELVEPLKAEAFDMEVVLPADPKKSLSLKLRLAKPPGGDASETLGIDGLYDLNAADNPDLKLAMKGTRWPLVVTSSGVTAKGKFDGIMMVTKASGNWSSSGDARLVDFDATGPSLSGDRLVFDTVGGAWHLEQTAGHWTINRLGLTSPVATLSASGSLSTKGTLATPDAHLEAKIDLAALAKQAPHALHLREGLSLERGTAKIVAVAAMDESKKSQSLSLVANISELAATDTKASKKITLQSPAVIDAKASREGDVVRLDNLEVKAAFLDLKGSGDLVHGVKLAGTVDLAGLENQLRDLIDFGGMELAGKGRMAGDLRKTGETFVGRYAAELKGLHIAGLTTAPIVRDTLRFDAAISGPADKAGLPVSWDNARVNLKSTQDDVALAAKVKDGVTAMSTTASVPVTLSGTDGRADARVIGSWTPKADGLGSVALDELRMSLRPLDPKKGSGSVAIAAKGTIDLDSEAVALTPLALAPGVTTPLTLAPEGLRLHGFSKIPMKDRSGNTQIHGDIAGLEKAMELWYGRPSSGLAGSLNLILGVAAGENNALKIGLAVTTPDISRPRSDGKGRQPEGPASLAMQATYATASDRLSFDVAQVVTRYAIVDFKGNLDEPAGKRIADLSGTLAPNWQTLSMLAAEMLEPKARLQGGTRPFHVKGPLSGDSLAAMLKGLDAELGIDLTGLDAFGLTMGPAPLVLKCGGGAVTIDPIVTTLNNGKVALKPGLSVDEVNGIALLLAEGSNMDGVEINDEVSKRVLSYIAPVLNQATHVNGKIALDIRQAEVPLTGPENRHVNMTGKLEFQNVVFAPGPFATELLTLTGRPPTAGVELKQPVELSVANGRVVQKGLKISLSREAVLAMEGSVGFDETLDLRATIPLNASVPGLKTGLDQAGGATNVVIPIDGTVSHPRINKHALQVAIKEMSKNVLKRELSGQASELMDKIVPSGGNAGSLEKELKGLGTELLRGLGPKPAGGNAPRNP